MIMIKLNNILFIIVGTLEVWLLKGPFDESYANKKITIWAYYKYKKVYKMCFLFIQL